MRPWIENLHTNLRAADRWLLASAASAAIVLVVELSWPHQLDVPLEQAEERHVPRERDPTSAALAPLAAYRNIADRPLFTSDRKPFVPPADPIEAPAEPAAAPRPRIAFELTAVITTPTAQLALLNADQSARPRKLAVGDEYEGWTLVEVRSAAVVLRNGRDEITVELSPDDHDSAHEPRARTAWRSGQGG